MADGCIETVNLQSVLLTGFEKIARLLGTASRRVGRLSSESSAAGANNGAQDLKVDKNETLLDVAASASAGPMHKLLDVRNLKKTFNKYTAVEDVSFYIDEGEFVGLVGPNGAGKTTTIHMTLGLIKPDAGEVRIFGKPFEKNREYILQNINFTAPYVTYPPRLTVRENLMLFAQLYDVRRPKAKVSELLDVFEVAHLADKAVSRLSSGESTRVGLCKAFINDPKLILLDEPTAFLDPQVSLQVKRAVLGMQERCGTAVLYTSHNMDEVQEMCNRVYFLSRGRIAASGSPLEVTNAILQENRKEPALAEAFLRVASEGAKK
jgi:ABC-2 type transport system ATP-binding protein